MPTLTTPTEPSAPIVIGERTIIPIVEALGAAMPARAAYPTLDPAELAALLAECGDGETGHLTMASRGFLILGGGHVIVVDTCLGGPKPTRPQPRPGLDSRWPTTLLKAGIAPEDVDLVINTHLHHDHVGWNTTYADGVLRPTFPNARYLIGTAEYAHATTGTPATHIADSVLPLADAGQLDLCEPDLRIDAGVRLVPAPGHTPGHTLVEITGDGRRALLAGDLIHHPLQLRRPDVSVAMCTDPARSAATRIGVLSACADTQTMFLATHLADGGLLVHGEEGYELSR